jgi:hypothetical protein
MTFEEFKNIVHTDLAVIKYSSDDFVKFIRFTLNQVADIIYYTNNPDKLFTIFKQSFVKSFEEKENNNCIIKVVVGNDSNKKVHYFHCQQDDHFKENLDPNDSQYKRLIFIENYSNLSPSEQRKLLIDVVPSDNPHIISPVHKLSDINLTRYHNDAFVFCIKVEDKVRYCDFNTSHRAAHLCIYFEENKN